MQLTLFRSIFCGLYWLATFVFYNYKVKNRHLLYRTNTKGYFIFLVIFAVYSVFDYTGGDYFGYYELYQSNKMFNTTIHMEPIYGWLVEHTVNYYQWRLVVWGFALILWGLIIKKLKLDFDFSALVFLLLVFYNFMGARQALGFCLIFYGLAISLWSDRFNIMSILLGLSIILSSLFFHRTMIVYCLVLLLALIPFRKWGVYILLCMFPVLFYGMDSLLGEFITALGVFADDSAQRIDYYLQSDFRTVSNIYGKLRIIIERLPVFLLLIFSIYKIFIKKARVPYIYETLLRMTFILIYLSYLFNGQDVSSFIAPRFWDAASFPMTIFVSYYIFSQRECSLIKISILLLVMAKLFNIFYEVYAV